MKVPANTHLFNLELTGAEFLGLARYRVVLQIIATLQVIQIEANLGHKELRIKDRSFLPLRAVHPAEIPYRKWRL